MRLIFLLFLSIFSHFTYCQIDNVGPGQALRFDGVNDYIDLGNIMDDLDVPFSVSAWVYIDPGTVGALPVIVSQDNEPIYNGFWFFVNPTTIWLEMGDGLGENLPVYRRGKMASVPDMRGRWVHVAATVNASYEVTLYLNGVDVGGGDSGASMQPMDSSSPTDVAKIGYFLSNGVVYRYKGIMDEVRVWNRKLSSAEIRASMCKKLPQTESGLIGNWRFDEKTGATITDNSINHWNGNALGGPTRVYSGAAIGDESVYTYTSATKSLQLENIHVNNVEAYTPGVHIYKVNSKPSRTTGTPASIPDFYYGVFTANTVAGNTFDLSLNATCNISSRVDNSVVPWSALASTTNIPERLELIPVSAAPPALELGPAVQLCDKVNYTIESHVTSPGLQYKWNTGETTSSIVVKKTGDYVLTLSNACTSVKDTVSVKFAATPTKPNLGEDELACTPQSKVLRGYPTTMNDYQFEWQNGSSQQTITVNNFGTYWLKVTTVCGVATDTLNYSIIPNMQIPDLALGDDVLACDKQAVTLRSNLSKPSYNYQWSTAQAGTSITVDKSGSYVLTVSNECDVARDTIEVRFAKSPPKFDLGDDEVLCTINEKTIEVVSDPEFTYEWQDGSKESRFTARDFGTFSVTVQSVCGKASDDITLTKFSDPVVVPNVITPNNDALNETFEIPMTPDASNLILFNRWGQEVYQSNNYQNDWDGGAAATGVYYYRLFNNCIGEKIGTVTILR